MKNNEPFHLAFIDYQKAFDTIETWVVICSLENAKTE